jgi:hypothetical protein
VLRPALAALIVLATACGTSGTGDVPRNAQGHPTAAGVVRPDRLQPGDCFDDQDDQTPNGFPVVPCGRTHANEAFHRFVVPGSAYPGQDVLTDLATATCQGDPFTKYVGRSIEGSALDTFYVLPSEDTWTNDGDRVVVCALFSRDLEPLTGSVEDSLR